ncbi:hypothetical protein CBOM_07693 [Ceraceosorus bombacis]|uniref:Uncharacterized protein n=1 Tax=Ceraceosorus bombacis TaxID=401625 RepID=A0A0P1BML8_9BASI|nr:hypothetical protein CBOM_07693 [Ceraceosorus bombacis]
MLQNLAEPLTSTSSHSRGHKLIMSCCILAQTYSPQARCLFAALGALRSSPTYLCLLHPDIQHNSTPRRRAQPAKSLMFFIPSNPFSVSWLQHSPSVIRFTVA